LQRGKYSILYGRQYGSTGPAQENPKQKLPHLQKKTQTADADPYILPITTIILFNGSLSPS
jgi:hypothetical protein